MRGEVQPKNRPNNGLKMATVMMMYIRMKSLDNYTPQTILLQ